MRLFMSTIVVEADVCIALLAAFMTSVEDQTCYTQLSCRFWNCYLKGYCRAAAIYACVVPRVVY